MKNFKSIHKQFASSKSLSSRNVVEYAILRSMSLNWENPTDETLINQAAHYLNRAFTQITRKVKLDNGREPRDTLAFILDRMYYNKRPPYGDTEFFETKEGLETYLRIVEALWGRYKKPQDYYQRKYVYIFVRQDISPEYQAVQAAHAACKMGHRYGLEDPNMKKHAGAGLPAFEFDEFYFALIGVKDLQEMAVAIKDCAEVGAITYPFYEPDIGNQLTAFGTSPIMMSERKRLLAYKKLKFK